MSIQENIFLRTAQLFGQRSPATLDRWASRISFFLYRVCGIRREVLDHNLELAFPATRPEERQRLAHESWRHFLLTIFETLGAGARNLSADVTFEGREHLDAARAQGKGVLLLCIHMGNWEALAGAVSQQVAPTHVVVKRVGGNFINGLVSWTRRQLGYNAIIKGEGSQAARRIFKALAKNELVGFVMDQYKHGAPRLPYFGALTQTNDGLATIWRRSGAPILPILIERLGPQQHVARVWPALELEKTEDAARDIIEATARFNRVMEAMVLSCPEQYFWLHDRWKWKRRRKAENTQGPDTGGSLGSPQLPNPVS